MRLKEIEIVGFKSFAKKSRLVFTAPVTSVVGPNGSGKSNVVEAFRFVLGEQSMKSMRGKSGADLIFRGGSSAPKLNRAAVSITFDNSDKVFAFSTSSSEAANAPLLFDTITFTRELFADGTSKYLMNGTEIRLKQMIDLLASVNIGTSSHHIISQGEADGILRANTRERREILEDALGLKVYHTRIKESESKLSKSLDTLKEVQSLRRELGPHLKFLQKQVEKIEKGRAIRVELEATLLRFLATERNTLGIEEGRISEALSVIQLKKESLEQRLSQLPEESVGQEDRASVLALEEARRALSTLREKRRSIETRMSRLEGHIEAHRELLRRSQAPQAQSAITFAPSEYHQILADIEFFIQSVRNAQTIEAVQHAISQAVPLIQRLKEREPHTSSGQSVSVDNEALKDTALEIEAFERELKGLVTEEEKSLQLISDIESKRESDMASARNATRERYEVQAQITQCDAELQILQISKGAFIERKERFDQELTEAGFLFGPSFLHQLKNAEAMPELDLHAVRRDIDRLKIRLDEHSGIGNDVVSEYEATKERDEFLARELIDVEASIRNLENLIIDLKKILDEKFTTGVRVINERFGEFFKTMFGGGSAFLSVTVEKKRKKKSDEELADVDEAADETDDRFFERGIDVHVNLPEKKVKELQMLSGGERSLVSIALLFAISQVNPPPFLVLDETDAALDEANSRRYGDMVERLSEYSQLIVVTHNRETMSRASVLYGVTLGSDGGSKLLSIKFDEAVKVAK
jgi:chromosome segregation protein